MAARKTTVTHADGTVSVRKSQSRVYTHAVEVSPAPAEAYAAYLNAAAAKEEARAAKFRTAAAAAKVLVRDRKLGGSADSLHSHEAWLAGTENDRGNAEISSWCSADYKATDYGVDAVGGEYPVVGVRDYLIRYAISYAKTIEEGAAKQRATAAKVLAEGVPVGKYEVVRWSSRADLAAKSLSEFDYAAQRGSTVRVVAVDA